MFDELNALAPEQSKAVGRILKTEKDEIIFRLGTEEGETQVSFGKWVVEPSTYKDTKTGEQRTNPKAVLFKVYADRKKKQQIGEFYQYWRKPATGNHAGENRRYLGGEVDGHTYSGAMSDEFPDTFSIYEKN